MEHNQVTFLSCYMRAAVQLLGVVLSWCKFELHKKKMLEHVIEECSHPCDSGLQGRPPPAR